MALDGITVAKFILYVLSNDNIPFLRSVILFTLQLYFRFCFIFHLHIPTGSFRVSHLSCLASSPCWEVIQQSDSTYTHTPAPFLLSPEISDSCRFFGPSLPPGCLTVLRCHGNRASKASSCDWYAAEVFPNLTPWLPLPLPIPSPPMCCSLPLTLCLADVLSGDLSWWVQLMCLCLYSSARGWHSGLPWWLIVLVDISPNWGSDMKDRAARTKLQQWPKK